MDSLPRAKKISLRKMLAVWLVAMIVLPTLPLAIFTWHGYKSEIEQLEAQLQNTNRQFTVLASTLLNTILQEVVQRLESRNSKQSLAPDSPFDYIEKVSSNGEILFSSISHDRIGNPFPAMSGWTSIDNPSGHPFGISPVIDVPDIGGRRVLVRVDMAPHENSYLIAYLNPHYLHEQLTSRFDSLINRHIYALDKNGAPIFYSSPDLVSHHELFLGNEPVKWFLSGKTGPLKYISAISKRARMGYVARMPRTGWGIVVSVDIVASMIDVRERFLWLVVSVIVAVVLAALTFFFFSKRLVFPLVELAREIRNRDKDLHALVSPSSSIDRIEELSQLVEDLNSYIGQCITAEKKTVQAEKLATLGELTTGLAHELGTPLNVVRGSAQLVKRKYPDDPASQSALNRIINQTERITELIRSLLDIARLEQVIPEQIEFRRLIEKVWETVSVMYPNVKREFHFPKTAVYVFVRRRPMEHALLNLFTNACQAMEGTGLITVRIVKSGMAETWEIEIEDTGPGIDSENVNQVFKPFFSTKSAGQGSGLGLALVERVIRENHGAIAAISEANRGAIFKIILPANECDSTVKS